MKKLLILLVLPLYTYGHGQLLKESKRSANEQFRDSVKIYLYSLVNQYRLENGLNELDIDPALETSCKIHAQYILSEFVPRTKFTMHWDLNKKNPYYQGKEPWERANCKSENMALYDDFGVKFMGIIPKNAKEIAYQFFKQWKRSPSHNENMLDPKWTVIGFDYYATITYWDNEGKLEITDKVDKFIAGQLFR
jgi:uncharacterized protein YkwD